MTKQFAATTKVPVSRTKGHIEDELRAYGCSGYGFMQDDGKAMVTFQAPSDLGVRTVRMVIYPPSDSEIQNDYKAAQENRRIWRSLLMVVKAKLESVGSGIESFDEAFLPHIMVPGPHGWVPAGEVLLPQIEDGLKGKRMTLLPEHT